MPMTAEQIRAVYAKRRTKGLYGELLATFIESGEGGVSVREEWPTQFSWDESKSGEKGDEKGKTASTLKQGFENAKDKKDVPDSFALIDVIVDGTDVYLLNRAILDATVTGEVEEAEAA